MKPVRFLLGLGLCLTLGAAWLTWDYSQRFLKPNVQLSESSTEFFIRSQWSFTELLQNLHKEGGDHRFSLISMGGDLQEIRH